MENSLEFTQTDEEEITNNDETLKNPDEVKQNKINSQES